MASNFSAVVREKFFGLKQRFCFINKTINVNEYMEFYIRVGGWRNLHTWLWFIAFFIVSNASGDDWCYLLIIQIIFLIGGNKKTPLSCGYWIEANGTEWNDLCTMTWTFMHIAWLRKLL